MPDPFLVLGLPESADDDAVRGAYLALLRENPPEKDADRFREISSAYSSIKTAERRATRYVLPNEGSITEPIDLFPDTGLQPHPVGIELWAKLIDETAQ